MINYELPTSLIIGEVEYSIRCNWCSVLDILVACSDSELDNAGKAECMIKILYPDWERIPPELMQEACEKACWFIDCGYTDSSENQCPKLVDWETDAHIIIPEINKVAGREIRMDHSIHWWTFYGWYMGIGEGTFSTLVHIRDKKRRGKKLEKWEQDFYASNKKLVDMKAPDTAQIRDEKDSILKWL